MFVRIRKFIRKGLPRIRVCPYICLRPVPSLAKLLPIAAALARAADTAICHRHCPQVLVEPEEDCGAPPLLAPRRNARII